MIKVIPELISFVNPVVDDPPRDFIFSFLVLFDELLEDLEPVDPPLEIGLVERFNFRLFKVKCKFKVNYFDFKNK